MKKFLGKITSGFKRFRDVMAEPRFFGRFKGLNTLVIIQLKDKLNLSFKADKKGALIKLLLRIILFLVVTVAIYFVFTILDKLSVWGPLTPSFPVPIFNLIFICMLILSTLTCISSLTKSLYFSRDNLVLLSYPVNSNTVFLSKLVVYYILSLIREAAFILPLFLAYGFAYGFPIYYFLWALLMYFLVCAIPVAIASIVSIPWMLVSMFFRKRPLLQDVAVVVLLIAATVFLFIGIDMIPENLHFLVKWSSTYYPAFLSFCQNFQGWLLPVFYVSSLIIGCGRDTVIARGLTVFTNQTGFIFLGVFGAVVILVLLSYLFAKPLFFKMAAKPFEFNKKIIFHNYTDQKQKIKENSFKTAFVPSIVLEKSMKRHERTELSIKLEKALNSLIKDEYKLPKTITEARLIRLFKSYTKLEFVAVPIEDLVEKNLLGFAIQMIEDRKSIVLVKASGLSTVNCYDPNYLTAENRPKTAFFSMMWKDVLMSIRTPGTLMAGYLLIIVGPLSIALLNKLFASINTSFMGDQYVVMFNILIMLLIPLVSNVSMASIYSREGESSYLLKASPSNYIKTLTSKLFLRWILMALSLVATTVVYSHYCSVFFNRPMLVFFALLFVYTAHLIWSAELDYMNPQDQLYKEVGEGNIANSNETLSGILAFVITALFVVISLILLKEDVSVAFTKLLVIGALLLACRVLLAVLKIKAYRTSRGERGRD